MYGTARSTPSVPRAERREDGMEPHMRSRLGLTSWATGALVLAAVAGCASNGSDPVPSASPSNATSSPVATSSSAAPTSPSDAAASAAAAEVRSYFVVLDDLRTTPKTPLAQLRTVAIGTQLSAQIKLVKSERAKGLQQVGSTKISELKVQSVSLDDSNPTAGKAPTAQIDVCWDVSGADLVDKTGKSVVTPSRPDRGWTRYVVVNYHWAADPSGRWRVASSQDLKKTPCAAS